MFKGSDGSLIRNRVPVPNKATAATRVAAVVLALLLAGCGSGGGTSASPTTPVTTTNPPTPETKPTAPVQKSSETVAGQDELLAPVTEAQWREQAIAWLAVHSDDLAGVSAASKTFGEALQARDAKLTVTAINGFLNKVAKTEADLPPNVFGRDLLDVMNDYVGALSVIRQGVIGNDQHSLAAGSDALSVAVAKFGVITARVKATAS